LTITGQASFGTLGGRFGTLDGWLGTLDGGTLVEADGG